MKQSEEKKWGRQNILKAKQEYWDAQKALNAAEAAFGKVTCKHRTGNMWCTHKRHTMKKYPGHEPDLMLCAVPSCPIK